MKKIPLIFVVLLVAGPGFGQRNDFFAYRRYIVTPPYGYSRILQLERDSIPRGKEEFTMASSLPDRVYASLTVREKFTYNMTNFESYCQSCSTDHDPEQAEKLLFAHLLESFRVFQTCWSERQRGFFKANKDSVIALIRDCVPKADHLGLNVKQVILDINATSLVPFLIATYRLHPKDHDVLTVLMLLMKQNQYAPFLKTTIYHTLYESKESSYRMAVPLTAADEDTILRLAGEFSRTFH